MVWKRPTTTHYLVSALVPTRTVRLHTLAFHIHFTTYTPCCTHTAATLRVGLKHG